MYHAVGASNAQQLGPARSTVGRKRYVAAFSNQLVIAFKSFTGFAPLVVPALVAERLLRDAAKWRFDNLGLDLAAVRLTLQRLPEIARYRRHNARWNAERPGQRFFQERGFDAAEVARRRGEP